MTESLSKVMVSYAAGIWGFFLDPMDHGISLRKNLKQKISKSHYSFSISIIMEKKIKLKGGLHLVTFQDVYEHN